MNQIKMKYLTNKSLANNIIGVVGLKGIALVLSFVMTPMYIEYFKDQTILGIWYTILSILTWILTFDLGIGNGLRNRLAGAITNNKGDEVKALVSSAYIALGGISALLICIMLAVLPFVSWSKILNSNMDGRVLTQVIVIVFVGIILQFFFKIVTSILFALRKNILANSLSVFTNVLILIYLFIPVRGDDYSKIIGLAIVYSLATIAPLIISTIYIFLLPLKEYRPSIRFYNNRAAKAVLSVGGMFFIIQLGLLVINSTNQIFVNNLFGSESVVIYTVYYRLFGMATMVFTLFTQPVWSEISVKYAQNNLRWIKRIYYIMVGIAGIIVLACFLVTFLLPVIFKIWLGGGSTITASTSIGLAFTFWTAIELFVMASTCIANGITELKCQTIFTIMAAIIKVPVTFLLVRLYSHWISIVIAHALILLPLLIAQNISLYRKFKNIKG